MRSACTRLILLVGLAACSPEVMLLETERPPPDTTGTGDTTGTDTTGTDTTTVQRAALAVTARVEGFDSVTAARAGMPNGVLPGADVTIQRAGASTRQSAAADSAGVARFTELLPGTYSVSVVRILTEAERALLTGADTSINAFGGGRDVVVSAPETEAMVFGRRSGRGSLVISEIFPSRWLGSAPYHFGTYLEVYNNTDTTIFLDGKLFLAGPFLWWDQSAGGGLSCEDSEPIRNDPAGVWATVIWRFPGSGQQFPLDPGTAAVLATDAVDHSLVDSRWPDLSHASFEFPGSADADNPAVPNMIRAAPTVFDDVLGHGERFTGELGRDWYLAEGVDVSELPTQDPYGNRPPHRRVPIANILDTFMSVAAPPRTITLCSPLVNPVLDASPAEFFESGAFYSIQRRQIGTHPDGRALLLRTRATRNDFLVVAQPTPGRAP